MEKKDDAKLSLKEQIVRHRENAACARCHNKIDPWGIALEAYDPTGRLKSTTFDASTVEIDGLLTRLREKKSRDFAHGFVRRMTGYALGRQLEYSDDALIEQLTDNLIANEYRASSLIEGLATSTAFLTK